MKPVFLDFEQPIAELTNKIDELRFVQDESAVDISDEIARLKKKSSELTKSIFSKLTPAQISQVSRHPQRPYTLDYINGIFTDFEELHGDRHYSDDHAIVGGLARFNGQSVMVIGHQKGRDTKEKMRVPCVYSTENITPPQSGEACSTDVAPQGLSCAGYGASMLVTASFGLYCAQAAVEHIAGRK